MRRSDYQREQRQMRRRIRELLAQRRSGTTGDADPDEGRVVVDEPTTTAAV